MLVDLEHFKEKPQIIVKIDWKEILKETNETGSYFLEAPMIVCVNNYCYSDWEQVTLGEVKDKKWTFSVQ